MRQKEDGKTRTAFADLQGAPSRAIQSLRIRYAQIADAVSCGRDILLGVA